MNDSTIVLLKAEEGGDVEEVEKTRSSLEIRCTSASLYEDTNDFLRLPFDEESDVEVTNVLAFLLTAHGGLHVSLHCLPWQMPLIMFRFIACQT